MTVVIAEGGCSRADGRSLAVASPDNVLRLVRACSPTSLQRRFFLPAPVDPEIVWARYANYLLAGPPLGAAVVATVGTEPIGLLNVIVVENRVAEVSLLVADVWQRKGVSTWLVREELGRPRWNGWTIRAMVAPDNDASHALVRGLAVGPFRLVGRDRYALDYAVTLATDRETPRGRSVHTRTAHPGLRLAAPTKED
jgi:GNAT superfamily N-acetyltransferase